MTPYTVIAVRPVAPGELLPQVDREPAADIAYARALVTAWCLKRLLRVDQHGRVEPGEFFYSEVRIVDKHGENVPS